jgi:hypothetical protein
MATGYQDVVQDVVEGVAFDGLNIRQARKRIYAAEAKYGISHAKMLEIVDLYGFPGRDPNSQAEWIVRVQASSEARGVGAIDWQALINALLPLLLGLCPK